MSKDKDAIDKIMKMMPSVSIVYARPYAFSNALKKVGRDGLAVIELYLQFNYRPRLQQIFTKHMIENYEDWKTPNKFKERKQDVVENFPVTKYPSIHQRQEFCYAAGLEVCINLN